MASKTQYVVTAQAILVGVGNDGNQAHARMVYKGETVPPETTEDDVELLLGRNLIAPVEEIIAEAEEAAAATGGDATVVVVPAGDPSKSWKLDELKKYATDRSIDLGEATTKDDILVILADAAAAAEAAK